METKNRLRTITPDILKKMISVIDLTRLNENDSVEEISKFCEKASTPLGNVAGVCVYPKFITTVQNNLKQTHIPIVSVANFPNGAFDFHKTSEEINQVIALGAHEVDIVFPYNHYLHVNQAQAVTFIADCKKLCKNLCMKVILETSAFETDKQIFDLSIELIRAGTNFLKTSTGKTSTGATLEKSVPMLLAIKESRKRVGFKASGGIKTVEDALGFMRLTEEIMGKSWLNAETMRIGASSLLDDILSR